MARRLTLTRTTAMSLFASDRLYLTDGGLETDMIFNQGIDLPEFASIVLLRTPEGRAALDRYFTRYIEIARAGGFGFVLVSATWRSSPDWGDKLGYTKAELKAANGEAIDQLIALRRQHAAPGFPILISGCVGPRGDGYVAGELMRPEAAEAYHDEQIGAMVAAGAELVSAITMTNANEAIGIARACARRGTPCVISFTVETEGTLPSGQPLGEAIAEVDAATGNAPDHYMINCAHPVHFDHILDPRAAWTSRIMGLRANASRCSHDELNAATELDRGDPADLAARYCCGTDHEHVAAMAEVLARHG
jgi:homocysteine S-methyltransferase